MTNVEFDAIGLHDLVELEAGKRMVGVPIEVAGWYHVEWINQAWGERHLEVEILGTHEHPKTLRKSDSALIRRHIRAADIPAIVEAFDRAMGAAMGAMQRLDARFRVAEEE